jgi:nicotinamidase-related amidase
LKRARAGGVPIFFVQHAGGEKDPFAPGSPGFPFCEELTPTPDESVTVKQHCSAFRETDLDQTLKRADIDELIICGMQTEYCVDTTVRAAVERGYRVTLVSDGHTTFDTQALPGEKIIAHHNATLSDSFARLKRADEIVF